MGGINIKFGTNGIRGLANEEVTPEVALAVGRAFGSMTRGRVAVGRDTRLSGAMLKSAAISGLLSAGCRVVDLDVAPTPAVQYYVRENLEAGLIVTASHNPREYNGFKLIDADGTELPTGKEQRVEEILLDGDPPRASWTETSGLTEDDCTGPYIRAIEKQAHRLDGLRVAVDPGCGAGAKTTPVLLRRLGCNVVTVNAEQDGAFPGRQPEPCRGHLRALRDLVVDEGAQVGVAHDGDADRAVFVDEQGRFVDEDTLLALVADHVLVDNRGPIVTPVSSSQRIVEVARKHGVKVFWTPIGGVHVARKMKEVGAVFGGEGNGGMIFPEHQYCRDGAMTTVKVLELVKRGKALSDLVEEMPKYYTYKTKIRCNTPKRVMNRVQEAYAEYNVDTTDGVKAWVGENGDEWVLIRASGTEPLIRVFAESRTLHHAQTIAQQAIKEVKRAL